MRTTPITVWAYVALLVATLAGIALFGPIDRWLFAGGALLLFASLGLVRGFLVAWLFLAVIHASSLIHAVLVDGLAIAIVANAALLTLLLAGPTRRHARRMRARARPGGRP